MLRYPVVFDLKVLYPIPTLDTPVVSTDNVLLPIATLLPPLAVAPNAVVQPIEMFVDTLLVPLPTLTEFIFKYGDAKVPSKVKSDSATAPPAPSDVIT